LISLASMMAVMTLAPKRSGARIAARDPLVSSNLAAIAVPEARSATTRPANVVGQGGSVRPRLRSNRGSRRL
jgi:hypothetical protein